MGEKEKRSGSAAVRMIAIAFIMTGGLNLALGVRAGSAPGPVSYVLLITGAALFFYGALGKGQG